MRNSKKELSISVLFYSIALVIIVILFIYDGARPKQRIHTKYQNQVASAEPNETIGKYDITHYIDAQAYNIDGELLVFISASGTKYHYTAACTYLLHAESKNITEAEAIQLGRTVCSACANSYSAAN